MKIFWKKLENTIANVSGRLETLTVAVRGYITSGHFAAKVTALLAQAGCQLQAFEMKYNIKQSLIKVLDAVQEFFKHTEMLPEWLKTADSKCKMSERFRNKTLGVKQTIETFDLISFSQINQNIVSLTNQINEQLKIFDIVRKIEGVRVFLREVKSSLYAFLDELRGTKISDALRKLEKVIETTIYNDIKIKVLDILEDVRERISNMDIREEIYFYLHRASMFYSNMVAFISVQLGQLQHTSNRTGTVRFSFVFAPVSIPIPP
uniref:Uncharacterized protein n=1 Tax=Takifugu rubripes TaxID=31033 RepID=A0A674NLD8_TAKRU